MIFLAVPSSPLGPLEVIDYQRTCITVRWKAPDKDGGCPITGYLLERKTIKGILWNKIETVSADTFKYCFRNLYENTDYLLRVIAVNRIGNSSPLDCDSAITARSPFGK